MLIGSKQAPAQLPALLQNLPLGSETRWLWPLINQDVAWQPPTPDFGIPLLLPRQQNSKAMGREMTIKRSQARQGPIQDPEWVVLALTWVLYPPGRVCPCVKDEVPWIMCSAAHTPHQLSWPYWSVIHQPVVTPMLWCPGDVSMPSRFTKGKQEKGPRTWGKLLKHQWSLYGVTHTKGHFNRMSRCSHMEKGLLKWK